MSASSQHKFNLLTTGRKVVNTHSVSDASRNKWTFINEQDAFPAFIGQYNPGFHFEVTDISFVPGAKWVKISPDGAHGSVTFKISAEEFAHNFQLA